MTDVPEVVFVCAHNANRRQIAAALLDRDANGWVHPLGRHRASRPAQPDDRLRGWSWSQIRRVATAAG